MIRKVFDIIAGWIILIGTLFCISKYLTLNQFMIYITIGICFSLFCFINANKKGMTILNNCSVFTQCAIFVILSFAYLPFTIIVLINILLNILYNSNNK